MSDCVMQEQAGLRQQVGSLTASLHAAEQAQSSAEAAVQEERQRSAEATQVNRLTICPCPPPSHFPSPYPSKPMLSVVRAAGAILPVAESVSVQLPASPVTNSIRILAFLALWLATVHIVPHPPPSLCWDLHHFFSIQQSPHHEVPCTDVRRTLSHHVTFWTLSAF